MDAAAQGSIYELWILGKTAKEIEKLLPYSMSTIKRHCSDFIVAAATNDANNRVSTLNQIRCIESELFAAISLFHKKPTAENLKRTKELQNVYSKFCAI